MPAPLKLISVEWLSQNAARAYPLADSATETDNSGSFRLPRNLIVDFTLVVDQGKVVNASGFYVSNVTSFPSGISLAISYTDNVEQMLVGIVQVPVTGHTQNSTYFIAGQNDFEGCLGKVTIGTLGETLKSSGSFDFEVTGGRLLDTTILPDIRGVSSLQAVSGSSEVSQKLYGDILLAAGQNVRLTVTEIDGQQAIRIDALASTDLNEGCGCSNQATLPDPIRTINGVPADATGNFQFVNGACIVLQEGSGSASSLTFKDTCSEPCCGSDELTVVQEDLNEVTLESRSLASLMEKIESRLNELSDLRSQLVNNGILGNDQTEAY